MDILLQQLNNDASVAVIIGWPAEGPCDIHVVVVSNGGTRNVIVRGDFDGRGGRLSDGDVESGVALGDVDADHAEIHSRIVIRFNSTNIWCPAQGSLST